MSHQRSSFARPSQQLLAFDSSMGAPPRPIESDLNSVGISLASASSPSLTDFGDLQPKTQLSRSSNAHDAFMRSPRQQLDPLSNWYTSQQGPWDPLRSNSNVTRPSVRTFHTRPGATSFSGYRTQTLPSESDATAPDHIPSDSGYGSLTRQSVADASLCGDYDQSGDTASISSHIAGIHFDRPMVAVPEVYEAWDHRSSANNVISGTIHTSEILVCLYCNGKVKTRSELKKHHNRHTKPYHCDVPECTRTEGFSTPNDVDRHRRSCHSESDTRGKYFRCTIAGCRKKDKKWPRADNFRQHLRRIHQVSNVDDDIDKYVCGSEISPSSPDLAGLVSEALPPLDTSHNGWSSGPWSCNMTSIGQVTQSNDDMGQQMAFAQDAVAQQHDFMSSAGSAGAHVPNYLIQISSAGLGPGVSSTPLENAHRQPEGLQGLLVSSSGGQQTGFEESSYFNEASISDEESERDDQSVIHHVLEPEMTSPEDVRAKPRSLGQTASRGCEELSVADEDQDAPPSPSAIILEEEDCLSTASASPGSSSSGDDAFTQVSHSAPKPAQPHAPEAPLDLLDVINDQGKAFDLVKALKERGMLEGLLEKVDYQTPKDRGAFVPDGPTPPGRDADKVSHVCSEPGCGKSFPRQCELKKHMKRHAKPYACTFPRCDKRFGSKNDWKRHENSQHYQLEIWKCNEKNKPLTTSSTAGEPPCARVFNRREQFKTHLQRDHRIADDAYVEQRLDDCLDGRNYAVRFWCGFCSKTVQVEERGRKAWLGRFNHIDGHLAGQMDISEWKNPDPGQQEVDVVLMPAGDESYPATAAAISDGAENGAGRAPKRGAEGGLDHPRPPKKPRQNGIWYCCGCNNQHIVGFSTTCLTPSCQSHDQCDECILEMIPLSIDV